MLQPRKSKKDLQKKVSVGEHLAETVAPPASVDKAPVQDEVCPIWLRWADAPRQLPGSPSRGSYVEHKIKPFEPIDRDDRFDYKADFAAYLHSINRDDLIP